MLARSRLLAAGLVVYPLLIALVVGVMVRYAGERPEVSLVGEDALPSIVHVGNQSFDFRQRLADATEVKLVEPHARGGRARARQRPRARHARHPARLRGPAREHEGEPEGRR